MTEAKVDRTTAERIAMMIREGMPIEEIADIENIPPRLVAVLEHSIALREGEGTKLERLMDLLKENTLLSQSNIELKDYAAKQLGKWLVKQVCSLDKFIFARACRYTNVDISISKFGRSSIRKRLSFRCRRHSSRVW